ncbi:amino acid adenylation domain-containing protein [Saccharibacillus brassicae]|uniref:Amino acid adenylation domain-containing protein n=2 Tax=Saccharibacillus brassicae TaxID=2583377 RepID=A0A4Y6V4S3_SACBS|nr:non-ribosomal peptide synthetase [Saccharibacillus brassicae]QDH23586.1 amino acid adenylation domain-containing protein [Saccharibacillus brassicae]
MWMTAQLFNHYMDDDPASVAGLDDLLIGGERLSQRHVSKLLEQPQRPRLINGYGPTENTTFSLMHVIEDVNGPLPIGRPIANSTAYILDPGGRLCGIGQPGELVVGGDGVAIGYLNRPEQTAEVFGEDPYAAGGIWYRTGDLARWRPDGTVDYLGRTDTQVKIRGYRVEPGEIEHELRSVSGVRDAAVTVREDEYGAAYLYGYAAADDSVDVDEIRRELGRRLPGYLVPASITRLERLPMTVNGKLDRSALPEPAAPQAAEYAAPQNEREAAVIEVFEDILGVRGLGRDASFFELGGHSLRATRAINRLEARTGVRLPLTAIFEAPTPAALALRLHEAEHRVYVPIPAAPVQAAYPMSSAQKRLYLIQQLEGAGTAYNLPGLLELEGDLDLLRIRSAFAQLTERHESLRTSFHLEDGELVQRIEPQVEAVVEFEEGEADEDREVWLSRFVRPFELDTAPLIRLKVIRTGGDRGALLFDLHHLIADGASMNVITREFSRLYAGESLPRPERQYKDYSEWMRLRDQGAAEEYWLKQFEQAAPVLDLPLDYPRGQMQSFAGASFHAVAPAELSERVRRLCRDTGTTEYMVFLSAYFILLSRYSRQADLVVGTPVAGRTHRDTETMVGMFVNTLAMRARPESDKRIVDFLREIKDLCLTGFDYQEFPFETLIDRVSFNRDLSRNPLFDVMFVHQNNEQEELAARHVSFGDVEGDAGSAKFDMTLTVDGDGRDHRIHWEYCTDLLGEATVRRYAEHFLRILEAMTLRSSQRIGQIDSLNAAESELIRETFSQGAVRAAPEDTFVDRWAEQAAAFPDRTAVVCGADRHTYGELEQKANRIANALISWGISPGDVVAFALPRGLPLVAAVLGILKSGAAFLPIEPDYPEDRIRFMVEDSRAKVIMTEQSAYALVFRHCKQVPVDVLLSGGESEAPAVRPLPSDLGYCIYTSGSTGTPKGAQLSHGNLMNYVLHARESYVKSAPVMPLFTSICFDLTLTSLFLPLLAGGRIHVYRDGIEHDLFAVFRDTELTIIKLTPSHLKLAAGSPEAMPLPGLECLIVGGEELESRTAREALRTFGAQIEIHNEYGPTETTVGCCDYVFDPRSDRRAVLIGRPIANTQTWIIGEGGSLCGIGMPGELCIGGSGVGRGYLNLPERSAETFVPDPYSPGRLLYRTGDLARWLPDGQIEYLGRIDEQVKIRGFRIELGEIEEVIKSAPGVADAALAIKRDPAGEPVLCAYVVGERPYEASHLAAIADRLRTSLPDYMIPERIMAIGALDVSANGKLDRKKLPDPVWAQTEPYAAPATELETELTLLFEQTLGVPRIGRTDHFFERGGNSIKAIKLIAGLRRLGHSLSIVHLFKHPTPGALAVFLDEQAEFGRQSASANEANPAANEAEPAAADAGHPANSASAGAETAQAALALMESRARSLAAASAEAVRPLSPVQRLSYRMGVRSSYAERALNRDVNPETFEVVMQGMFRRHPLLRSTFVIGGETWERRELACPARIDVPLLDWSAKPEAEQEAAIGAIRSSYAEFDDESRYDGTSLAHRMILIKRSRNDYLFLMTCTHLIFDGMSSQAFCDRLSDEYGRHPGSGEHGAEVYDYQHYVDQILSGPVGVTEAEIVERLDLNRFRDSVVRYRKRLSLAPLHAFRTVCEVEGTQSQGRIEALPELPGELYRAVLLFLFPDASIPILNVHTGRTYTDRRYHDYLGEFIDFVPCVVDPSAQADYGADIADKLEFMSRHNINMSALLVDEELRGRYPGLSALLADIRPEQLDIPVYNDLSIFDAHDVDAEPFLREEAERSAARADDTERFDPFATGIVWNGDRFYIQTVCTEGREDELAAYLRSYIHKRLSELPVL